MKNLFSFLLLITLIISCESKSAINNEILVDTEDALNTAIKQAEPGDVIVLKNGVWKDLEINFKANGTEKDPITIQAETEGEVIISGVSHLKFGGSYLVVNGLHFKGGYAKGNVVDFKLDDENIGNHCTLTNSVIEDFNKMERDDSDRWVQFWGRHNTLSNCYIAGKTNRGPTIRIDLKGNEHINNYHQIINNHFGPRPPKGGASGETIQLGDSYTSMAPSYTLVENNLFEECNGEVEIISSKTNFNQFKNNVFYKSEGSLVTRHGNYCTIEGNYFIGDGINENIGGIRVINSGHTIINNYFYNLIGKNFRSPLAVMNGIPKSPQNRYNQVTDVVVAYNSYVNCVSPWQFGVGVNTDQKDVLPASEIRSAVPIRTIVANNTLYNKEADSLPIVAHDKIEGVTFKSNIINNQEGYFNAVEGLSASNFEVKAISENIYIPTESLNVEPYVGFDFDKITEDIFGNSRASNNNIGAFVSNEAVNPNILDKSKYGPSWFSQEQNTSEAQIFKVAPGEDIQKKIDEAQNGDVILLSAGNYSVLNSLKISKNITVKSADKNETIITYTGKAGSALFELNPKGFLSLDGVTLKGNNETKAFASLKENMFTHFGLNVYNSTITNFNYVLKVYKQAFAERISFINTSILNCENGLELSEEINDKGDYNTEYLTIKNCEFNNVKQNVVDYYRGGYDESTIGGNLIIENSVFTNSGSHEKNGVLLNHRGIVNVTISQNSFKNNPVKFVSVLWGAKNNSEINNTLINSGEIKTEQNLKLTLMY
ncbi:chondroitinase-B domain-containing protein [Neotamlana laminarinivorans]|uniref:Alginate lyase n=1 Tax=Neotamlana laminarinivorans TaxID=2883124 RepID=A0A9X1I3T4_9FLAO|nr:chondroitinase-B domain-containing protein [Tamlana laminarinivorans]MCB4800148.1 alginate lyase [Tamlana laminarinivorans]